MSRDRYLPTALNFADLTLATSPQLAGQLKDLGCRNVDVWRKGVDTDVFSSAYNVSNLDMRMSMTNNQPERPLLLYVGRLGRTPPRRNRNAPLNAPLPHTPSSPHKLCVWFVCVRMRR